MGGRVGFDRSLNLSVLISREFKRIYSHINSSILTEIMVENKRYLPGRLRTCFFLESTKSWNLKSKKNDDNWNKNYIIHFVNHRRCVFLDPLMSNIVTMQKLKTYFEQKDSLWNCFKLDSIYEKKSKIW